MTTLTITLFFFLLAMVGLIVTLAAVAKVLYFFCIDAIEIYSRGQNTGLDLETRRAKLDYWREFAEMRIEANRQKMLTGGK